MRDLLERFYRAFLAADEQELTAIVAPTATWVVPLDTALSGAHRGPEGIAALRRRFLAVRGERRLDSHEAVVAAVDERRIVRLFHYLHDPDSFAAFWR